MKIIFLSIFWVLVLSVAHAEPLNLPAKNMTVSCESVNRDVFVQINGKTIFKEEFNDISDCENTASKYERYINAARIMDKKITVGAGSMFWDEKVVIARQPGEKFLLDPLYLTAFCGGLPRKHLWVTFKSTSYIYYHEFGSVSDCAEGQAQITMQFNIAVETDSMIELNYTNEVNKDFKVSTVSEIK